ncbi:MAG TPA: ATP synthase F1 subunit gamma [Lachnospiraceae bacterium]|nr:ATP synthase F1 subunit gamma [Lachnospiraceae bacterium]
MASNMKAVKLRIKSVTNTRQITKAMELVASSKLRRAKDRADRCRPYLRELRQAMNDIAGQNTDFTSAYTKQLNSERSCCVLITGDRGMAGGYNSNVFKMLEADMAGKEFVVLPIGKKSVEYARSKHIDIVTDEFAEVASISVSDCFEIAQLLCDQYKKGSFGHIQLCYTSFKSMLSQSPVTSALLPIMDLKNDTLLDSQKEGSERKDGSENVQVRHDVIWYEPDAETVFNSIVPEFLAGMLYASVCESLASELAARRNAMDAATKNADEMLEQLNLYYNRARQASITQEITEIVAGADGV